MKKNDSMGLSNKLKTMIFGSPIDTKDSNFLHRLSLIPILAWIGLGADGLSSSAYGPEEAYRTLGSHTYLAVFIVAAMLVTVFIISYSYSKIIEHFPNGGGGYLVATHTLGDKAGVVSGSALIVDYILTITVSISSCGDALFSFLSVQHHHYKLIFEVFLIVVLIILNIRGVRESVTILAPIFAIFIASHILLIIYGVYTHSSNVAVVYDNVKEGFSGGLKTLGTGGMLLLFLHAYSMGGGTYTGIEAVSNGLQIMREPKVQTGKRTMLYMAVSLAFVAAGIFLCYLLFNVKPVSGKTLNAVLASNIFSEWHYGKEVALITILSESFLLFVAAQAGFIDGPRVMANMAVDSWFPHRFAALSERLSMRNGIVIMGVAALLLLFYTHGNITTLVVMYSINVFLTFSLSQLGMIRFFIVNKKSDKNWKKHIVIHVIGLLLCGNILVITLVEKFMEGGWITVLITTFIVLVCMIIKKHYLLIKSEMDNLNNTFSNLPIRDKSIKSISNDYDMTAVQLVGGYNGFGIHTFFSIIKNFPNIYGRFIFVSIGVIDSGSFKGAYELNNMEEHVKKSLEMYVTLAESYGYKAEYRYDKGTDVVDKASEVCESIANSNNNITFFTGQLTFRLEKIYHRFLHNEIAFAIQRRLQWKGLTTVILPIRVRL